MDNQHKQIKGYRDLSQEEIDLMNKIKALAEQVGELVDELQLKTEEEYFRDDVEDTDTTYIDAMKWVADGKKDLQLGFMQLIRAVAKPTTF
jgi:L-ribulose-5-phosphate 3-epimerase UlaE